MTTATLAAQRPATTSLRPSVHRRGPTILKRPRYHQVKNTEETKPVLLRNLRNYYARRRPSTGVTKVPQTNEDSPSRKVQFLPRVRVKRIPSRLSYTDEDRLSMWVPKKELKQMVSRNYAESAWEGRAWQEAPEEEEFTEQNGKLIHPLYIQAQMWSQGESEDEDEQEDAADEDEEESTEDDEHEQDDNE